MFDILVLAGMCVGIISAFDKLLDILSLECTYLFKAKCTYDKG